MTEQFKFKKGTRVDCFEGPDSVFNVHTGTIVGTLINKEGRRFYQILWDGSVAAHSDGVYPAELVEREWKVI